MGENLFIPGQFLGLPYLLKIWQENVTPAWTFRSFQVAENSNQDKEITLRKVFLIHNAFT